MLWELQESSGSTLGAPGELWECSGSSRRALLGGVCAILGPTIGRLGDLGAIMGPHDTQEEPKRSQERPQTSPRDTQQEPTEAQDEPTRRPRGAKIGQKRPKWRLRESMCRSVNPTETPLDPRTDFRPKTMECLSSLRKPRLLIEVFWDIWYSVEVEPSLLKSLLYGGFTAAPRRHHGGTPPGKKTRPRRKTYTTRTLRSSLSGT